MTNSTQCRLCDKEVKKKYNHVEEEITYWEDEDGGKSFTYFYHNTCFMRSRR